MSGTIRHCPACGCQTRHLHLHDCAHGIPETHMHGSERFQCQACGHATFAHSDGAARFPFVLDAPDRRAAFAHAMVRP
jgi:hypothetical protein